MKMRSDWKGCPIRFAAGEIGDAWTLVLLRDLMLKGKRHFREFLEEERAATNIVADRLSALVDAGIILREIDPARRNQVNYTLTTKGCDLVPAFLALIDWSARYDPETEVPEEFSSEYRADPEAMALRIIRELCQVD
jgi:DNA-binding HxlR family transcriptional regulator